MAKRKRVEQLVTVLAICLVLIGLIAKIVAFQQGRYLSAGGAILFYSLQLTLFIVRRPAQDALAKPAHLLFVFGGTFSPFLMTLNPAAPELLVQLSLPLEALGILLTLLALATLGRGFGVIAARRELKTHGLYRWVRHPLYAGEAVWFLALILQNVSVYNLAVFAFQTACQIRRMQDEEFFAAPG